MKNIKSKILTTTIIFLFILVPFIVISDESSQSTTGKPLSSKPHRATALSTKNFNPTVISDAKESNKREKSIKGRETRDGRRETRNNEQRTENKEQKTINNREARGGQTIQRDVLIVEITVASFEKANELKAIISKQLSVISNDREWKVKAEVTHSQFAELKRKDYKVEIVNRAVVLKKESPMTNDLMANDYHLSSYSFAGNYTNYYIPDKGYTYSDVYINSAPSQAVVTEIDVTFRIEHSWVSDLWVEFANDYSNEHPVLWAHDGCMSDCGYDDDYESDYDIYLTQTFYTTFDGQPVNQGWYLDVWDDYYWGTGFIDYFEVYIYYQVPDPDLIVTDIWLENPSSPIGGQPTEIHWEVKNIGASNANRTFYTRMYIDGTFVQEWYTPNGLPANWYTDSYTVQTLSTGTHTIKVITDYYNVIYESNEGNNSYSRSFIWAGKPDLMVYDVWTVPANPIGGQPAEIHWEVDNIGSVDANSTFYTRLYIDGNYIKEWYTPGGLPVNYYTDGYTTQTLSAGNHKIEVITDYTNIISESNENNNKLSITVNWSSSGGGGGGGGGNNIAPTLSITKPAGNDSAYNSTYNIMWTDSDPDNNAVISLYYYKAGTPSTNATLIVSGINEDDPANSYNWNTSGIAQGTYYIMGIINDGVNAPVNAYSTGTVSIGFSSGGGGGGGNNIAPTLSIITPLSNDTIPLNGGYNIIWSDSDPDNNARINLYYYNIQQNPSQAILIVNGIYEDDPANSYYWNAVNVPAGRYYIMGIINDGVNAPVYSYSKGTLTIGKSSSGGGGGGNTNVPPTFTFTQPVKNDTVRGGVYTITWEDSDPDNNALINLYYQDANSSSNNGTLIASGISENDPVNAYPFNTTIVSPGTYRFYASINDGVNPIVYSYSSGTITIPGSGGGGSGGGKITGNVSYKQGNTVAPVPNAVVIAVSTKAEVGIAYTDSNGNYSINGLAIGTYYVLAYASGYVGEFYDNATNWQSATKILVYDNIPTSNINFELKSAPLGSTFIAGRITSNNQPVNGAWVYAKSTIDGTEAVAMSNNDGIYTITNLPEGTYRVWATKIDYNTEIYSQDVSSGSSNINIDIAYTGATEVENKEQETRNKVQGFTLEQNYPNPFNPVTTICYGIQDTGHEMNYVSLKIYNATGQLVRTLVNGPQTAGYYAVIWDGKNDSGVNVPSGMYFYTLQIGSDYRAVKKMVLVE